MRASDQVLHEALAKAGLDDLAERAATGEWNDYFGKHALNGHHLIHTLMSAQHARLADQFGGDGPPDKETLHATVAKFEALIERVKRGDFDGTLQEAREWGASPEGLQTFADLVSGK